MKPLDPPRSLTHESYWSVDLAVAVSWILGWCYFAAWSFSFYPQVYLNHKRHSTTGFSYDYSLANLVGFVAYAISTGVLLWSPEIKREYAQRHPNSPEGTVRFNDFIYALHATIICTILHLQFFPRLWGWKEKEQQKLSWTVQAICYLSVASVPITAIIVAIYGRDGGNDASTWAWLDVIYVISYIKLILTVLKYIPQLLMNFRRQSTVGFSISVILLDFAGGIFSLLQLFIDATLEGGWGGVTGNQAKFWLGNITLFFDLGFFVQHYGLYGGRESYDTSDAETNGETRPLLDPES